MVEALRPVILATSAYDVPFPVTAPTGNHPGTQLQSSPDIPALNLPSFVLVALILMVQEV